MALSGISSSLLVRSTLFCKDRPPQIRQFATRVFQTRSILPVRRQVFISTEVGFELVDFVLQRRTLEKPIDRPADRVAGVARLFLDAIPSATESRCCLTRVDQTFGER